jgi:predicted neuraminidase
MRPVPFALFAIAGCVLLACQSPSAPAADNLTAEEGFVPLFNGKDLSGWVPVNVAPETFSVRDGEIVTTGKPTGVMRTERQYENFIIELDWKHITPGGNSGMFVWSDAITAPGQPFTRAYECQILDEAYFTPEMKKRGVATGQGDLFAIHGSVMKPDRPHPEGWMRCLPSENRTLPAGNWNHYRVECNDGVIKLAVNGKVVSGGSECHPRKGYICLEAEGAECHFRNIRLKELPSTGAKGDDVAKADEGFKYVYPSPDLAAFVQDPGHKNHWRVKDWIIDYDGKSDAKDKTLWTQQEYGDFQMVIDWRLPRAPVKTKRPIILPTGEEAKDADGKPKEQEVLDAGDSGIFLRGADKAQVNIWCWPAGSGEVWGYRTDPNQPPEVRAAATPKVRADNPPGQWNRFLITMRGDRLTVGLNGKTVIDNARLPGVPPRGRIGLQHHGDPVQFGNIYIKKLDGGAAGATAVPNARVVNPSAVVSSEFIFEKAPFASCHASTIAETKGGLVGAWFGGTREGAKDVGIWLARHDGQAWSSPAEVATGANGDQRYPCWNPVLFQARDGPLLLFYKVGPSPSRWWGMLMTSEDAGRTWSAAKRLPEGILGPIKNKPVQLEDGAIVCGSSTEDAGWRVHMERTADLGKTWGRTDPLNGGRDLGLIQPGILNFGHGRLAILCRSRQGKVYESFSEDAGKGWTHSAATDLPNPNSGIDAVTLKDGRSLLVYNHTTTGRTPLNIATSADGKSWAPAVVLEDEKGEFSYPAVIQAADGKVHVTYTWKRQRIKHVVLDPTKIRGDSASAAAKGAP